MKTAEGKLKVAYYNFGAKPEDKVPWVDYPDLRNEIKKGKSDG
jgi:hypothetical protein